MSLSFFGTINAVLRQGLADVCRTYRLDEPQAVERAKQYLSENSEEYYSDSPNLQYNDPLCRLAYIYAYVGAHANLMSRAIFKFTELRSFLEERFRSQGRLTLCSLGGGPGSELLGIAKFFYYLAEEEPEGYLDIDFQLVDQIPEWGETWNALANGLERTFEERYGPQRRQWPIVIGRSFLTLDFTKLATFQQFSAHFSTTDIFIFNYALSEVLSMRDDFEDVFHLLVERAKPGAYFLFIDRRQGEVLSFVQSVLARSSLVVRGVQEEQSNMDASEQKEDLGTWHSLMGRDPKLTWNGFYALAQKEAP